MPLAATEANDFRPLGPRTLRTLRRILWLLFFAALGTTLLNLATDPARFLVPSLLAFLLAPIVCLGPLWLLNRDRQRLAIMTFIWGLLFFFALSALLIAGVRTPAISGLVVVVLLGTWLVGPRHGLYIALISCAFVLSLGALQQLGWLELNHLRPPLNTAIVLVIYIISGILIGIATSADLRDEIQRSAKLTADLAHELAEHQRSEVRFITLFQANPLPTQIGRQDGTILDVNQAWVETFGIARDAAIGQRSSDLPEVFDAAGLTAVREQLLGAGSVSNAELQARTRHGIRRFIVNAAMIETGETPVYVATLLDQTDRIMAAVAQEALNQALEVRVAERTAELQRALDNLRQTQLELAHAEKIASLGSLVAGISHELNTPIGNALVVASALRQQVADFREGVKNGLRRSELDYFIDHTGNAAELMERATYRANELIQRFKELARDQVAESRREFSLHALIVNTLASRYPENSPWQLCTDIPETIICHSYPGALGQVLDSVLANIDRHAFAQPTDGTVRIEATIAADDRVLLRIADNGVGMSPNTRAHAFDPFFTTQFGHGQGLGLAVCHRLTTSVLGGEIEIDSAPGAGCVVRLSFPRVAPAPL